MIIEEKNIKSSNLIEKPDHKSVLVAEVLEALNIQPNKTYLDVTFGCGGHSRAILEKEASCKVIALDWDKTAIDKFAAPLEEEFGNRFKILWGNFGNLYKVLKKEGITQVDGILADFGTSQFQINKKDGFSFMLDTPLDMRMSPAHHYFTAYEIVNRFSEERIADILYEYGEEKFSRKIAKAIVEYRKKSKINTTLELAELVKSILYKKIDKAKRNRIHPATKTFQALRIFVNKELENLKLFLPSTTQFLSKGGRLACISFHSLEDRMVKNFMKNNYNLLSVITKKPIVPTTSEIVKNPSSRSSKLRIAEKI